MKIQTNEEQETISTHSQLSRILLSPCPYHFLSPPTPIDIWVNAHFSTATSKAKKTKKRKRGEIKKKKKKKKKKKRKRIVPGFGGRQRKRFCLFLSTWAKKLGLSDLRARRKNFLSFFSLCFALVLQMKYPICPMFSL